MTDKPKEGLSWNFPRTFWVANGAELFERAAWYGMFVEIALYLTRNIGFNDQWAGIVAGCFGAAIYFMPTFSGLWADKVGFRKAVITAFGLLTIGYILLGIPGVEHDVNGVKEVIMAETPRKLLVILALILIVLGGSIIKPVISGTAALCSSEANRARAFSIFYAIVNIGSFTGKFVASPIRQELGLVYINFYSALMAFMALVFVILFYREVEAPKKNRTLSDAVDGLLRVLINWRFMALIIIVAGFWTIQHQLYASIPKYVVRTMGDGANPEWLANINPAVVVLFVVPITHMVRNLRPISTIMIAMILIPFSSLTIAMSPFLTNAFGSGVPIGFGLSLHPITIAVSVGIAIQGIAECFLSPKFLEFASNQAPPGEVGLYMGYSHLHSVISNLLGFSMGGFLLAHYCPDPTTLSDAAQKARILAIENGTPLPPEYAHAHYIWYYFVGIGVLAFLALMAFNAFTRSIDKKHPDSI